MVEKINFDFTKEKDRKKFEKLPKEGQKKIVGEAQEEASLINEIVGEKGSKEDYEIIAKLAEEEIASQKEIEVLKEIYSQKLDSILNSQLTVENIEMFADNALAQTTNLIDDIKSQYQKYQKNFEPAALDNKKQENKALMFFGLPDIPEILQSIIKVKEKIDNLRAYMRANMVNIDEVITPPDNRKINAGDGQGIEQKRMFPRVLTLLYILEHDFDISPTDAPITRGIVMPNMVRQTPYARVEIPDLDRAVYLCDEEGNVSYVFDAAKIEEQNLTLDEIDIYSKEDKNFLISRYPGIGVRIRQTNMWRDNIASALKEPISEVNIIENSRQISEFRRERVEWLSFKDFQREVRSCYSGEGDVVRWYRKEYKNHNHWPSHPNQIYQDKGWEGWSELTGKENPKKKEWLSFETFQQEVKNLYSGEGNVEKWYEQEYKNHNNWPACPELIYKYKGWEGLTELVGKENKFKKEWLSFKDFQLEVKNLYFGKGEVAVWYRQERKNHNNWPSNPNRTYQNKGWEGWPGLVGKESQFKKEYPSFEDFQLEVKNLYPGKGEVAVWYRQERKNHNNWPSHPNVIYQDKGWEGWPELVGKENQFKKKRADNV